MNTATAEPKAAEDSSYVAMAMQPGANFEAKKIAPTDEPAANPSTALTVPARAALALGSSQTRIDLAALVLKSVDIKEIKNKAGREECHSAYMVLKNARVAITHKADAAVEDAKVFTKAVNIEKCALVDITSAEELRLQTLRDAWDTAEQARKDAEIAANLARITAIHVRIAEIRNYLTLAMQCRTAQRVQDLLDKMTAAWLAFDFEGDFEEFCDEAQAAYDATKDSMKGIIDQKKADEDERARIAADQAAAAQKLADERAELDKQKAEQERERSEQAERDRVAQEAEATRRAEANAEIDRKAAKLAEDMRKFDESVAAEAARLESLKPAPAPVVIAPAATETVAHAPDNYQPTAAEIADGVVDAEVIPDTPKNQAVLAAWAPANPSRPTDRAMLGALALHFKVTDREAFTWLYDLDFDGLSDELLDEEKNA